MMRPDGTEHPTLPGTTGTMTKPPYQDQTLEAAQTAEIREKGCEACPHRTVQIGEDMKPEYSPCKYGHLSNCGGLEDGFELIVDYPSEEGC